MFSDPESGNGSDPECMIVSGILDGLRVISCMYGVLSALKLGMSESCKQFANIVLKFVWCGEGELS